MKRTLITIGLVALGATATLAATSVAGGDDGDIVSPSRGLHQLAAEEVSGGEVAGPAPVRQSRRGPQKVTYIQTSPILVLPQTEEAAEVGRCPKGNEAVGGYFATGHAGTFLDLNQAVPGAPRKWRIGVYNATNEQDRAIFGIVCLSDVK